MATQSENQVQDEDVGGEESRVSCSDPSPGSKTSYPYASMSFLLGATIGQGYVSSGMQSVLELYFVRFLFVCFGSLRATSLGTAGVNIFIAVYQVCAVSAGILADKLIGNYLTQTFSVIVSTTGVFFLAFSTWQYAISEPSCCYYSTKPLLLTDSGSDGLGGVSSLAQNWSQNCTELHKEVLLGHINLHVPSNINMFLALFGLILYAVGYGHINTLQSVFVADQFKEESKAKTHSFSWYYLCCNIGALGGESGLPVLRQSLGFIVAWLTVLGSTLLSTVLFLSGSCFYVKKKPIVFRNGCCGGKDANSHLLNTDLKTENTPLLQDTPLPKPHLHQLRQLLPFLGVFGPLIVFWAIFYQQNTTWVLQGTHMDCYIGKLHIPPDMMPSVNDFMVIAIIPVLEYLIYPHLEKTMNITIQPLHKVTAGMVAAILSFLMSGLLEIYVRGYQGEDCHGNISLAWQLPQLFFISIAEVTVCVTGLEFAYSQAPLQYRNSVTAMWYLSQALGTLLNAGVAQIHQLTLLQEFFVYMSLMVLVTLAFSLINRQFRYTHRGV